MSQCLNILFLYVRNWTSTKYMPVWVWCNSEIFGFYTLHWKNNVRSPTVPLDQPSLVINTSESKTLFVAYLVSSLNDIGKHSVWEGWLVVDMHGGGSSAHQISNPDLACLLPTTAHTSTVGTVAQARIRRSMFSCRPGCHTCRWSSHSLLSWRMLWYRLFYAFVLIYSIVFITDCFIRMWHTKRILMPSSLRLLVRFVWAIGFYIC